MNPWTRIGLTSVLAGTAAAAASAGALALLARLEGRGSAQPFNATSHWLHGDDAADREAADLPHTAVGGATHLLASGFWAVPLALWHDRHPPRGAGDIARDAAVTAAVAAAVDYGLTPHRFTPGWELVLSKRSMAVAYGALALGLALGAGTALRLGRPAPADPA